MHCVKGETLSTDASSVLKQKLQMFADKSTATAVTATEEQGQQTAGESYLETVRINTQLHNDVKYLQDENKALKEQVGEIST